VPIHVLASYDSEEKVFAKLSGDSKGKLVMVTSADYPPYEFRETASGDERPCQKPHDDGDCHL
jgi:hypothetical protein